jgi:hypothetical protein
MTIKEALDALPDTPEAIAALFVQKGIKYDKTKRAYYTTVCPMAQYLSIMTGQPCRGTAREWWVDTTIGTLSASARVVDNTTLAPSAAKQFVYLFDEGNYPELRR